MPNINDIHDLLGVMTFDLPKTKRLLIHSQNANTWSMLDSGAEPGPGLILGNLDGVHISSNGLPPLKDLIYADGMAPNDDDWFHLSQQIFGEETGCLALPISQEQLKHIMESQKKRLHLLATQHQEIIITVG